MSTQPPDVDNGHMLHIEEDCLSLNVYSPVARGKFSSGAFPKLPVMFYSKMLLSFRVSPPFLNAVPAVHGGGLTTGNSGPFPYNTTTDGYVGNSIIYTTNLVSYGGWFLSQSMTVSLPLDGSTRQTPDSRIPSLHCVGCRIFWWRCAFL
ncbi:hypothetical protein JVU11DRAFT_11337 [Chiua virens]|nr:hypothetical protein JVU11DRAFT_11337 [Chiua virens]